MKYTKLPTKEALCLSVLVLLCYVAAFLSLPFTFIVLFFILCYTCLLFLIEKIYWLILGQKTHEKYCRHKIRYRFIIVSLMVVLILGRWVLNHYGISGISTVRISMKVLLLVVTFYLGRCFLVKGMSKTTWLCIVVYCLLVISPVIRALIQCEPTSTDGQVPLKALQTLGYASWTPVKGDAESSVTIYDKQSCYNGVNIYSSTTQPYTYLMDMQGNILHTWYLKLNNTYEGFFCAELLENGDLLAVVKNKSSFIKLGWDSQIKWETKIAGHHDLYVSQNGDIYVLAIKDCVVFFAGLPFSTKEDYIAVLNSNGKIKDNISLHPIYKKYFSFKKVIRIYKQLSDPDMLLRIISNKLSGKELFCNVRDIDISLHTNTVEIINKNINGVCSKGDILTSSRDMSLVVILNVQEQRTVWTWGPGVISGQHQPTLLDNGNIMMLDNGWESRNYSRVIELDPVTKKIKWEYTAAAKEDFFTSAMGGNQRLPNGNTLITEAYKGRVFEITKDGEIVWEFYNPNQYCPIINRIRTVGYSLVAL
jgi:hypothetical protein